MTTIALEFVPPTTAGGPEAAREEAAKARDFMREFGLDRRVNSLLVPGMISEESDRPVALAERLDPLTTCTAIRDTLDLEPIVTQVTAFDSGRALGERIDALSAARIRRAVFVGVPRTMQDGEGPGLSPMDALGAFHEQMPDRGVILIPTRDAEKQRFEAKVRAGATFALTQLLFSDRVADLLSEVEGDGNRPEILLSFAYVPKRESRVGLIRWLIRDETDAARDEMRFVEQLAPRSFAGKRAALVDLFKRVTDRARETGFPIGLHFETPYGFSRPAFETFAAMLETWEDERPATG